MQLGKVLVIIINYNQTEMTIECVESVLNSKFDNFKILLIDNGSEEAEFNVLNEQIGSKISLKRIELNCGYVRAVNFGLEKGKTYKPDYYLIMNNDTILDENAIQCLVETSIRRKNNSIVSGKVYDFDQRNMFQTTGSNFTDRRFLKEFHPGRGELDTGQCNQEESRDMLDDIFWLVPYKLFMKVGFYSENFFLYGEQADYALRAVKKGFNLIYTPCAVIWHKGSLTTGSGERFSPAANFWRKKGSLIYLYRNTKKKYFYFIMFKTLIRLTIINALNFLKLRNVENRKSEYAALLGCLYGIKWVIHKIPDNGYNPFL